MRVFICLQKVYDMHYNQQDGVFRGEFLELELTIHQERVFLKKEKETYLWVELHEI